MLKDELAIAQNDEKVQPVFHTREAEHRSKSEVHSRLPYTTNLQLIFGFLRS